MKIKTHYIQSIFVYKIQKAYSLIKPKLSEQIFNCSRSI